MKKEPINTFLELAEVKLLESIEEIFKGRAVIHHSGAFDKTGICHDVTGILEIESDFHSTLFIGFEKGTNTHLLKRLKESGNYIPAPEDIYHYPIHTILQHLVKSLSESMQQWNLSFSAQTKIARGEYIAISPTGFRFSSEILVTFNASFSGEIFFTAVFRV